MIKNGGDVIATCDTWRVGADRVFAAGSVATSSTERSTRRQRVLLPQIPSLCRYYTISPAPAIPSASNFYWCRRYAMFACVAITIRTSDCSALRPSKIALKLSTCVR